VTLDPDAFDAEADELDDVEYADDGNEGNRLVGGRAARVAEYLARKLVDEPDGVDVDIETTRRDCDALIVVRAAPGDVGRLIGRRGRTVQALRQVARAAGSLDSERIQLDVVD
jgi:predicted RNA-binding protein YlqC (UPF0109 family)